MRDATLFDVAEFLPAHVVHCRKGPQGTKKGNRPINAKFDEKTHVVRVPVSWHIGELVERIELVHSVLYDIESELVDARLRSETGTLSNRFEKLATFAGELREAFPRGDCFDPFKE